MKHLGDCAFSPWQSRCPPRRLSASARRRPRSQGLAGAADPPHRAVPGGQQFRHGRPHRRAEARRKPRPAAGDRQSGRSERQLGTEAIARADADGYTIGLANTSTHAVAASLSSKLAYDPIQDFAAIAMLGGSPFIMLGLPGRAGQYGCSISSRSRAAKPRGSALCLRRPCQLLASRRRPVRAAGEESSSSTCRIGDRANRSSTPWKAASIS